MTADESTPTPGQWGPTWHERPQLRWLARLVTGRRQTRWSKDGPPELKQVIMIHRHPATLFGPTSVALLGLAAAIILSTTGAHGNGLHQLFIWLAWFVLVLRLIKKISDWWNDYLFVTSERIIVVSRSKSSSSSRTISRPHRKIVAIWLAQVTAVTLRRTVGGKLLGYGDVIFQSQCPDAALVAFDSVPYPNQVYLELRALVFPGLLNDLDP